MKIIVQAYLSLCLYWHDFTVQSTNHISIIIASTIFIRGSRKPVTVTEYDAF